MRWANEKKIELEEKLESVLKFSANKRGHEKREKEEKNNNNSDTVLMMIPVKCKRQQYQCAVITQQRKMPDFSFRPTNNESTEIETQKIPEKAMHLRTLSNILYWIGNENQTIGCRNKNQLAKMNGTLTSPRKRGTEGKRERKKTEQNK